MTNISPGLTWCENYTELIIHNPLPHDSVRKESACNAGDPSSIPGSGRSAGGRTGYPLQYSWAYFVAQLEKNPLAMQETWVQSLGWEDALEKGKATHSSILAWRIPWTVQSMGLQRVRHDWATFTLTFTSVHFRTFVITDFISDIICMNNQRTLITYHVI